MTSQLPMQLCNQLEGPLKQQCYPEQLQLWQDELTGTDQKKVVDPHIGEPKSFKPSLSAENCNM